MLLFPLSDCHHKSDFVDLSFRIVKHLNAVLEFFVALLNCVGLFISWTPLTYPPYNRKIIYQRCSWRDNPSLDFSTDIKYAHSKQVKRCHCVHFKLQLFSFFLSGSSGSGFKLTNFLLLFFLVVLPVCG